MTLRRSWLDGWVKVCMHRLSFSGIVRQDSRSVAEYGTVAREMVGVDVLSVYIIQNSGRSSCLPMVTVTFWCLGMSSNAVTTRLASAFARSLFLMVVCPLILCSIVGRPRLILF